MLTSVPGEKKKVFKWKSHAAMQSIKVHFPVLQRLFILSSFTKAWWSYMPMAHGFCRKYCQYCSDGYHVNIDIGQKMRRMQGNVISVTLKWHHSVSPPFGTTHRSTDDLICLIVFFLTFNSTENHVVQICFLVQQQPIWDYIWKAVSIQ